MGEIIGTIVGVLIGLFVVALILQGLRRVFAWLDWVFYILYFGALLGLPITLWIVDDFWSALGAFLTSAVVGGLVMWLTGLTRKVKVNHGTENYTLECRNCHYNDVDIITDDYDYCDYECPRCGRKYRMVYQNNGHATVTRIY